MYELQNKSNIIVEVTTILGQPVYSKNYGILERGKYKLIIPTLNFEPSTYVVKVISESTNSVRRLIVVE